MNYGYIRVSTTNQTVENQRFEIENFCANRNMVIDVWKEETISGTKTYSKRVLGKVLKKLQKGDTLIITEISRLGRSLLMIMEILNILMNKEVRLLSIKDRYELGDNIQSKVLAFAFGISAEIERTLISQRTKEALARLKSEGKTLGHPKGQRNVNLKLSKYSSQILRMKENHVSNSAIARKYNVNSQTVVSFIKRISNTTNV